MLSREALELRVSTELGIQPFEERSVTPPFGQTPISLRPMPLGTLLHIAAGNVDGLPAFSVVEGLLTGNVNLLKLPQADSGLSLEILQKLMELEPDIREFLYVFDTPSSDLGTLKRLADLADGIVVWGGETAVAAVRRFAPNGVKLIEWGHRLSFAYISGYEDEKRELAALARHIVTTKQLLCSSCQTIFLDTDSPEELVWFCQTFLPYLDAAAKQVPATIGETAERTLPPPERPSGTDADGGRPAGQPGIPGPLLQSDGLCRPGTRTFRPVRQRTRQGPAPGAAVRTAAGGTKGYCRRRG